MKPFETIFGIKSPARQRRRSSNASIGTQEVPSELQEKKGRNVLWKLAKPTNYTLIPLRDDGCKHLVQVDDDKCLWSCYHVHQNKAYMRCIDERPGQKRDCPGRGNIEDGVFTRSVTSSHNHQNNHDSRASGLLKYAELKKNVVGRSRLAVRDIWREWIRSLDDAQKHDYDWCKVRSALYSCRNSVFPSCPTQDELSNLLCNNPDVKQNFAVFNNQRFYQGMFGGCFVFVPVGVIGSGKEITGEFFADATFGILPLGFYQMLIVKATIEGKARPVAYALMNSKKATAYENVFNALKLLKFSPTSLMMDFERAAISAAQKTWHDVQIRGCYFHFCQCLWKNAVKLVAMGKSYNVKAKIVKMFMRLALGVGVSVLT